MMDRRKFGLLSLGLVSVVASQAEAQENNIEIVNPWVKEAPPGVPVLAGYLLIKNNSKSPISIVGSHSSFFKKVEIHKTEVSDDGMARMTKQTHVLVPPGGVQLFEPGGLHLMLMQPSRRVVEGDAIDVTFEFENGSKRQFTSIVKRL